MFENDHNEKELKVPLIEDEKGNSSSFKHSNVGIFLQANHREKYRKISSYFTYFPFFDVLKYLRDCNSKDATLSEEDIPLPYVHDNIEEKMIEIDTKWIEEMNKGSPNLLKIINQTFRKRIVGCIILYILFILTKGVSIFTFGNLVKEFVDNYGDENHFSLNVYIFLGSLFLSEIFNIYYWYWIMRVASSIKLCLMGLVYKKMLVVSIDSLKKLNIGNIIGILVNDLNILEQCLFGVLPFTLNLFVFGGLFYFTWEYFGFYALIGFVTLYIMTVIQDKLFRRAEIPRAEKFAASEKRMKFMREIVQNIKTVKIYAWEKAFKGFLEQMRQKEHDIVRRINKAEILAKAITEFSVIVSAFLTFTIYVLYENPDFTLEKVYVYIIALKLARIWCLVFPAYGRRFNNSTRLLYKKLLAMMMTQDMVSHEHFSRTHSRSKMNEMQPMQNSAKKPHSLVIFKNFTAYWNENNQRAALEGLNLTIKPGEKVAIVGRMASGKTSVLLSLMKEMAVVKGDLAAYGSISLVENEPYIFPGTIRFNITLGSDFDDEFYNNIIDACLLRQDLKKLSDGDDTKIGDNQKVVLTKAQKTKICLARAMYFKSDIFLLDDPFSKFDIDTGTELFNSIVKSDLLLDKTVLITTNHEIYARKADKILALEEGKLKGFGTFEELTKRGVRLSGFLQETIDYRYQTLLFDIPKVSKRRSEITEENSHAMENEIAYDQQHEDCAQITSTTYDKYTKFGGILGLFLILLLYFLTFILLIGLYFVIGLWTESHSNGTKQFEDFWAVVVGVSIIVVLIYMQYNKMKVLSDFFVKTNTQIHNQLIGTILRATITFFSETPAERIFSRLSADVGTLDRQTWINANDFLEGMITVFMIFIGLFWVNLYLLGIFVFTLLIFRFVFKYCLKPFSQVKIIDLAIQSPLFEKVSSTISGLLIIRTFKRGPHFISDFTNNLYSHLKLFDFGQRVRAFLSLIMSLTFVIITSIAIVVIKKQNADLNPSLFATLMMYLFLNCSNSSFYIRQGFNFHTSMQSAQRIFDYLEIPQEAPEKQIEKDNEVMKKFGGSWPTEGRVNFQNVYLRYYQNENYVLKNLSFDIKPKTRIAFVGRPGAGKNSISNMIFRLVDYEERKETMAEIDGVKIREIGLDMLRNNMAYVPSDSVVFTGSLRRNLDPYSKYGDQEIWQAIDTANLRKFVESLPNRLNTELSDDSRELTMKEKQLITFARILLKKNNRILIIEDSPKEADSETDRFIQEKIHEIYKDSTIIKISKRLTHIADYDFVIALNNGCVAENDLPYLLMVKDEGDTQITKLGGWFARLALASGQENAEKIFKIAFKKYSEMRTEKDNRVFY